MAHDKFVHYDYTEPNDVPAELISKFNFIAADPPFLAEECLTAISHDMQPAQVQFRRKSAALYGGNDGKRRKIPAECGQDEVCPASQEQTLQ